MSDHTKIEWTEATWNVITGCSVESAGCKNCYAMKLAGTRLQHHPSRAGLTVETANGPVWTGEVRFNEQWLDQPLRWKRPRMIFVCAHGDLFHPSVPDEWIDKVFAVMALCPQHTFQVLTKRAGRMRAYANCDETPFRIAKAAERIGRNLPDDHPGMARSNWQIVRSKVCSLWPLPNVWIGVSVENQKAADERIPLLLQTPAAVRWISAEPLLGPVDLTSLTIIEKEGNRPGVWMNSLTGHVAGPDDTLDAKIDWVVVGGESGPNARPMHPQWARSLRDQCAGVPFLFKQWGEFTAGELAANPEYPDDVKTAWRLDQQGIRWHDPCEAAMPFSERQDVMYLRVGKKAAGRLLDGVLHDGYPVGSAT